MKSLSEICQLVKDEYVDGNMKTLHIDVNRKHLGLCSSVSKLEAKNIITYNEYELFTKEYKKSIRYQIFFYDIDNSLLLFRKNRFKWKPSNREARIKWLDKRILN